MSSIEQVALHLLAIHSFISIHPERPGWQEQEPSHMKGINLAVCTLGNFLEVVFNCFPPTLNVPTFTATCLHVRKDARDSNSKRWNLAREIVRKFCLLSDFHVNLWIFYISQIYDVAPMALLPLRMKPCTNLFPKSPTPSAGFELANLGIKCLHATPRQPAITAHLL